MARLDLRCRGDAELEKTLLEDASVRLRVADAEKKTDPTARGNLLATSVRLAKGMSARVDGIVADCRDLLGIATDVETYVYPEPTFNAACLKPQHGLQPFAHHRMVIHDQQSNFQFIVHSSKGGWKKRISECGNFRFPSVSKFCFPNSHVRGGCAPACRALGNW